MFRSTAIILSVFSRVHVILCVFGILGTYIIPAAQGEEKEETLGESKARYKKADNTLNTTYKEVLDKLAKHRLASYKQDQRDWVEYRDYMADYQGRLINHGGEAKQTVTYWSCMADLTESRCQYLKHWVGVKSKNGWDGDYVDGKGGHLSIKEVEGKIEFSFEVVRGPTYHLGIFKQRAEKNQFMARFTEVAGPDGGKGAWITFLQEGQFRIKVIGVNTAHHHGARAYFDGLYIRSKSIPTPPRKIVE